MIKSDIEERKVPDPNFTTCTFFHSILRSFCNTDLISGLWMKTLASSVLSTTVIPEVWMGCCRSSLIGLVMKMMLVSLEQTFLKPTKTVSAVRMQAFEISDTSPCRIQSQQLKKALRVNSLWTVISPLMAL